MEVSQLLFFFELIKAFLFACLEIYLLLAYILVPCIQLYDLAWVVAHS